MKKIIAMANPYIPTEDKETVIGKKRTNYRSNTRKNIPTK